MVMKTEEKDTGTCVILEGELNYDSCRAFEATIVRLIDAGVPKIVVVMDKVSHIDSMGLGALAKLWKQAETSSLPFVLAAVPDHVSKVIKLINLDNRIKMYATIDKALA